MYPLHLHKLFKKKQTKKKKKKKKKKKISRTAERYASILGTLLHIIKTNKI